MSSHHHLSLSPASARRLIPGVFLAVVPAALASAGDFGNDWVSFVKENSRLVSNPAVGLNDQEEKDYATADLNQDGWTDLVVVRKQPQTTEGRRTNVLFMNENGTLVDRTAQYATAADVTGDQGFLTPTNDRDVVITDVDDDGWLDVVTAVTLSPGQPKHISHPRVYRNLGNDTQGQWLGLRFENFRFPQLLLSGGTPSFPRFCGVDAGDVTGDDMPDLYFSDYDAGGGPDMNDRLLINDGTGVFIDESSLRMTAQMLQSAFGTSTAIDDMNLDGVRDIVKDTALFSPQYVAISYNDPGNEGFFDLFDDFHHEAPYHVNTGDLNRDGRVDVVVSDDGLDRYRYNLSTDTFGRVVWGPPKTFTFLSGGDDGFAGNNYIVDLNNDEWADIVIADVDVDIPDCGRRCHIYHNPGGAVGQQITLLEEAQQAGNGGWKGVGGITANDLQGMYDVAVFDIDNDGDVDMVFGRCGGTDVWMSTLDPNPPDPVGTVYCSCDGSGTPPPCSNPGAPGAGCANSTGSGAVLAGFGSNSAGADDLTFEATNLLPNQPALLFSGDNAVNGGNGLAFGDGLRCAGGDVHRLGVKVPNAIGTASWGPGLQTLGGWAAGDTRRFQTWYRNPSGGPCGTGFNLTNGTEISFVQ